MQNKVFFLQDEGKAQGYERATADVIRWLKDGAWEALGGTESEPPTCMYDRDGSVLRALADQLRAMAHRPKGDSHDDEG